MTIVRDASQHWPPLGDFGGHGRLREKGDLDRHRLKASKRKWLPEKVDRGGAKAGLVRNNPRLWSRRQAKKSRIAKT